MRRVCSLGLVLILVGSLAACSGAATPSPAAKSSEPAKPAAEAAKPAAGAKKLEFAHITAPPESAATHFQWMADEVTKRSSGSIAMTYHGGTLLTKELEIMDAVKSGNLAMGTPAGAASSVFPELGVFLSPYLVRDYDHAYKMFNGDIGKQLGKTFEDKYKVKLLFFYDFGFRHFWGTKRAITKPDDLRGLKMRVQQGKVFTDTVNGLGASAVPMPWGEVVPGVQQGVIDGADLPIVNIDALKIYEVAKYASLTYHNYGPTLVVMNLDYWNGLTPEHQKLLETVGLEAQARIRKDTESVDSLEGAKRLLEPKGMTVNAADVEAFRAKARDEVWPKLKEQYADLWDKIVETK
jgi:tripartite ATP-independent transporter DctP family solute receptor